MLKRALLSLALATSCAASATTLLLPQNATLHCTASKPCTQPTVDGTVVPLEYADGHAFPLQNFQSGGANGALFVSVTDTPAFSTNNCNVTAPPGTPSTTTPGLCASRTLYLGLALPRGRDGLGALLPVQGSVTILLDGSRPQTVALAAGATLPRAEDRQITVRFDTVANTSGVSQTKGAASNGMWMALGASAPFPIEWKLKAGAADTTVQFEAKITLPAEPLSSASRMLGLGLAVRPVLGTTVLPATGLMATSFPASTAAPSPAFGSTLAWETLDLRIPTPIPFSMSVWNVGQMPHNIPVGDGGSGEIDTIAKAIFKKQAICLTEIWEASERVEIVEEVNSLRAADGLPPMFSLTDDDDADNPLQAAGHTGLMVLSSQPILQGGVHHFPYGMCTGADCLQHKGVIWARVQTPAGNALPPAAVLARPVGGNYGDFVDLFCTHVNAGDNGPGDDTNRRNQQFEQLAGYVKQVRSGGPLNANVGDTYLVMDQDFFPNGTWHTGMDRPAYLLGDMNTIGPKGSETSAGLGAYNDMISKLGLTASTAFEASNSLFLETRDLAQAVAGANPSRSGTWLTSTCANTVQAELGNRDRIDYVLAFPPDMGNAFPTYAMQSASASVDAHFDSDDGSACLSDHAEVAVDVALIKVAEGLKYNPAKRHRVEYAIISVKDLETDSGCCADWYSPKVFMSANGSSWTNTYLTEMEGSAISPNWFIKTGGVLPDLPAGFGGGVRTSSQIFEADSPGADDHYDAIPEGGSSVGNDDRDFTFLFNAATGVLTRMRGTSAQNSNTVVDFVANFSFGFTDGVSLEREGNDQVTENNARAIHFFNVTEID